MNFCPTNKKQSGIREFLLKWTDLYGRPPGTNSDELFFIMKLLFFNKTAYLNDEVNSTEPSPSVWVPKLVLRGRFHNTSFSSYECSEKARLFCH
jgi:hypothetical protein